ncbi:response regulator transcription factor [Rubellimicrobium rubrum]|uniref:Response regulator transcription factor n=1 Tax=Rubellimicrobium rubrum TaxID=2585369 RepID=A0A5C4MQ34_9RHOB|nr:response regulator transcription factor [Rubellimicrobium rubrum]TNC47993.1 response regulator transcription factor [Rubellimicrobium rubrum]
MQVMILDEDPALRTQIAAALTHEGFDVLSFGRVQPAKDAARLAIVDVLVLGEAVDGRLAHDVALLAEWRNPGLGAILLSDRQGTEFDELFELIPSLQAVLGRQTDPRTLAQLALSAVRSRSRRHRSPEPDLADELEDDLADMAEDPATVGVVPGPQNPADRMVPSPACPARTASVSDPVAPAPAPLDLMPGQMLAGARSESREEPALKPASVSDPASTVLSAAETRGLLSDLARRYATMNEQRPGLGGPAPAPQQPPAEASAPPAVTPAATLPAFEPLPPVSRPEPPARIAGGGRRLHLA